MNIESARYCFVVADEAKAIIYCSETRRGPLRELCAMTNNAGRMKTGQMISDRGGRAFDSHGDGRHTMQNEKADPKRHASAGFAKDVVHRLSTEKNRGACREFALIAAPRFLGLLRDELESSSVGQPFLTFNKDLVNKPAAEIRELITQSL